MLRLASSVAPRILMLSENWITELAILTEVRSEMVFNRWDVPKRIASDLDGFCCFCFGLFAV